LSDTTTAFEVPQGRLESPFHRQLVACDTLDRWHTWNGYTVPDELYCSELEYFAIRNSTAVFDLSPMNKYRIEGPDATAYLDRLVTRDMTAVDPGQVAYATWCDDRGQVIDDGTIFNLGEAGYRLCSQERHYAWLDDAATGFDVSLAEETADVAALAVQGPTSYATLANLGLADAVRDLRPFRLVEARLDGIELLVSRTGFTGDLGYELWTPAGHAADLWDALFEAGRLTGIRAIGTDALDLARIEAGYLQAYRDFLPAMAAVRPGRTRSPLELGLRWLVDFTKPVFNGRAALAEEWRSGSTWRLVRLDVDGNKAACDAYLYDRPGKRRREVGFVTSAAWSPVLKKSIALGTVRLPHGRVGDTVWADIYYRRELEWSRQIAAATVVAGPFWDPPRRRATPPESF